MIAGIHIPVELHRHIRPTLRSVDTHRVHPKQRCHSRINILNKHIPHIGAIPLIKHLGQETPIRLRTHTPRCHTATRLAIQQGNISHTPATFRLRHILLFDALHNGNELHVAGAQLVAEIAVDLAPVLLIRMMHRTQHIAAHTRSLQMPPPAQHHCMRPTTPAIQAIRIMHPLGTVNRHPHQHIVLRQKLRPPRINQRPIGLQRVNNPLRGTSILLTQLHQTPVKRQTPQRRLPALPQHRHLAVGASRKKLRHIRLQSLLTHLLTRNVVQQLLRQEKTVLTVQIARRTRRLCHHRKMQLLTRKRSRRKHCAG